jgi:hypothetical protein
MWSDDSGSGALRKVLVALKSIHGSLLPPSQWERFEQAVAAIQAGIATDDLAAVTQAQETIDGLDPRQQNVAGSGADKPVRQPPRARTASDNLSRTITEKQGK